LAANLLRVVMMTSVAIASALVSAEAVVGLSAHRPGAMRAATAEASLAAPAPAEAPPPSEGAVPKASDGHYWADGEVNGAHVRFLVDTGATAVALTPQDAERLGIDVSRLRYGANVVTAGGAARAAAVRLASVTVAGARLDDVDALVIEKGLDASLLGMSYLGRLSSFQATRQALVLRP
jgi:aspartyl protease family protein